MKSDHPKAIYPGTFDPVTNGHIDLIHRALEIFDKVIIAVANENAGKKPLFSVAERVRFLKQATRPLGDRVQVEGFSGLVVDFARRKKVRVMIRGVRMISDFEYEFQMALTNRKLAGDIETLFLMPHESHVYISSRLIKEIALLDGDISSFVPDFVLRAVRKKMHHP